MIQLTKKVRTKIPIFKVPVIKFSGTDDTDITSIIENVKFRQLIKTISYESIKYYHNKPFAKIFIIKNTDYCFNIKQASYKNILAICLKDFEKNEDYEKCIECKKLIDIL